MQRRFELPGPTGAERIIRAFSAWNSWDTIFQDVAWAGMVRTVGAKSWAFAKKNGSGEGCQSLPGVVNLGHE